MRRLANPPNSTAISPTGLIGWMSLMRLEDRVLMSATPFLAPEGMEESNSDPQDPHFALASGGDGFEAVDLTALIVSEDDVATKIDLGTYFDDPLIGDSQFTYEILDTTGDPIVEETLLNGSDLEIRYAQDAFGSATVVVRGSNGNGSAADAEITVTALPVNDRPTTNGLDNVNVMQGQDATFIDLFAAFDDVEDVDEKLTFSVTEVSNPDLFDSIEVDTENGLLILDYADDALGTSDLTVRATDTSGAYVEMSSQGGEFELYSNLLGDIGVHRPDGIEYSPVQLLTPWWFGQNETVDFSSIDEALFRARIRSYLPNDPNLTVVFNLEDEAFTANDDVARGNLAFAIDILADERPDLTNVGAYRVLPQREFWVPFSHYSANQNLELGIATSWSTAESLRTAQLVDEWEAHNSLYRTEVVAGSNETVADRVSVVFPSLYTPYANSVVAEAGERGVFAELTVDAEVNVLSLADSAVAEGMLINLRAEESGSLPTEIDPSRNYYVLNVSNDFDSFQISESLGGDPVVFETSGQGRLYAKLTSEFIGHDAYVSGWADGYALPNLDEAGAFGKNTVAYLSPSFNGVGVDYLNKDFFRHQLDTVFAAGADGAVLFNLVHDDQSHTNAADPANQGWWEAVAEFQGYINSPTQFSVTVAPPSDVDEFSVHEDTLLTVDGIDLLSNDNVGNEPFVVRLASGPSHAGWFALQDDGSFQYSPDANFSGMDEFQYEVVRTSGTSAPVLVRISVDAVNDAPIAALSPFVNLSVGFHNPIETNLDDVFFDVDGHQLSYQLIEVNASPSAANIELLAGVLKVNSAGSDVGIGHVIVQATDSGGMTSEVVVSIGVYRIFSPLGSLSYDPQSESVTDHWDADPILAKLIGQDIGLTRGDRRETWRPDRLTTRIEEDDSDDLEGSDLFLPVDVRVIVP